jgi:Ca2+/H+ antiporter, TMEM165/GDT1 family
MKTAETNMVNYMGETNMGETKMKRNRFVRGMKFAVFALAFAAFLGLVVMSLWNWLMPALFGWHLITYWQALGVLILAKILFGGFRGRPRQHMYWRRRMLERWEHMTPEEREKFRQSMASRCGSWGSPAAAPRP